MEKSSKLKITYKDARIKHCEITAVDFRIGIVYDIDSCKYKMVRTMIKAETKYSDSVVLTGEAISRSFRHTDYDSVRSMALLSGIYKTRLFDFYTSFLFSYIPVAPLDSWDIDAQWISNGRFAMHLYLVAIKNPYNSCYDIYYEYRTKFLNEEKIKALHNGICEIIEHGSDNPEMTLNDIYKKINN